MTGDPVEVIARAIADLWWRTGNQVPADIARAALAALEEAGLVVVPGNCVRLETQPGKSYWITVREGDAAQGTAYTPSRKGERMAEE